MKKEKQTDEGVQPRLDEATAGSGLSAFLRKKQKFLIILLAILLVLGLAAWGVSRLMQTRNQQAEQKAHLASNKLDNASQMTPSQLAKSAEGSSLNKDEKAAAIVAASFRSFYDGDYKTATALSKPYLADPKYHRDILCVMHYKIYESKNDTAKTVATAKECAALYLKDLPKDELAKQLRFYRAGLFYSKAGNTQEATKYLGQFISYVESNNKQDDELLGPKYLEAKGMIQ